MTVESEVANLTTAVDNLTSAVNVKKATLDASVANAQSARDAAAASATSANNDKLAAQAAATSATNTAAALTGFDLEAIAASKAVTAVDVFVYDTSKDSDGGAWRKRTQHTSWYNETLNTATRGSRREFPAVAVIVAEGSKVTIYDGDDPALPMWMVFNASTSKMPYRAVNSLSALNGVISTTGGSASGVSLISFVADDFTFIYPDGTYRYPFGSLSYRDTPQTFYNTGGAAIVSNISNDVAMTVLPNAPIDPATGLPVPTIAVATAGGVSVIKDDGTVVDITHSDSSAMYCVDIYADGYVGYNAAGFYHRRPIPTADLSLSVRYQKQADDTVFIPYTVGGGAYLNPTAHPPYAASTTFDNATASAIGFSSGITHIKERPDDPLKSMYAYTTSTYNTGWMNGDIKGAFLSSTDTASLVGGDIAVNGTFDTDATGWNLGTDWQYDAVNQRLARVGSTYHNAFPTATIANLVVGQSYTMEVECGAGSGTVGYYTSSGVYGALATGINRISFTYKGGTYPFFYSSSFDRWIDNFKVFRSSHDRSVNADGKRASDLIVNGTVTRSPVATGAELVAYSGFSASNYLEQPYNSALDFGTGDFCVMGWVKHGTSATQCVAMRQDPSAPSGFGSGASYRFQLYNGNVAMTLPTSSLILSYPTANVGWVFLTWLRRNGVLNIYANGSLLGSSTNTDDLTNTSAITRVGILEYNGGLTDAFLGSLALLRISATAPTAEQIKKIYEDEKVLFQDNAACTLYGTSDAVTALAHDEDTGLLHVGTSAGRSVFQGLRRVSNTTTAVGTAISASGGMVVEE